jgi:hypothetical protein
MKVLITGCTAQQASNKTASRTPTFSALLAKALEDGGAVVEVVEPSTVFTSKQLEEFDSVLVGIAPPTSLSANKIYPAFAIANRARKIGNLSLFIDAPEQYKLQASLKSVSLNVADLSKDFYQRRKSYSHLISDAEFRAEVHEFNEFLFSERWPTTLYPAFPWSNSEDISKSLLNTDSQNLVPVMVDSYILRAPYIQANLSSPRGYWTCDNPKTKWAKAVTATLTNDVVATRGSRWEEQESTLERIKKSLGTIVSIYRNNEPWWSPALAQSLSVGVPVVTDWRLTSSLGVEWSHLASSIEEMSSEERYALALAQKESYLELVPTWEQVSELLLQTINLSKVNI